MTQRFYFDLSDGQQVIKDDGGVEASGVEEVMAEARVLLAEMRTGGELPNEGEGWELLVRDERGEIVASVPVI